MLKSVTRWLGVDSTDKGTENAEEKRNETVQTAKKESAASATAEGSSCETITKRKTHERENESKAEGVEEKKTTSVEEEAERDKEKSPSQDSTAHQKLENATAMALDTAKQVGNVLYSYGRVAGSAVVEQANKLKNAVQEKGLMGNFSQEHEKFVAEKKMCRKLQEDAVAPWVGYNEEDAMKEQILNLSTDRKHFLRDPPADVQYEFEFATAYPVALATLREDGNLRNMRFALVPQKISEERFWRNYFYRVSLIKQSVQLKSLEQQQGAEGPGSSSSSSSRDEDKKDGDPDDSPETLTPSQLSPPPRSHVQSDRQQADVGVTANQETAKKTDEEEEEEVGEDWERVQQKDVEDYEGGGGGVSGQPADEEDQEVVDLLQQIDQETDPTQALC